MALDPTLQLPEEQIEDVPHGAPQSIGNVRDQAAEMLRDASMLPKAGAPGAPPAGNATDAWLKGMTSALPMPPKPKEGMFTGAGRAFMGGAAELGHQATGAANWATQETLAPENPVRQAVGTANQVAGQSALDWQETLSPQDRELMARQWTSLDPHQTIWQGGPHDFVHSLTLQMANAAPSALTMLLPMGAMAKAGMTGGALAYVGATQTGLSIGQISNNIQQEIASRDDNTLRQQSPAFSKMLDRGMDPAAARAELNTQAQRYAPVVGGLVSGAIATLAGRFLTPVMTGAAGAGMLKRAGLGFLDQAAQGAGIGGANYVASETAAHVYDKGRAPDLVGGLHAAGEAAVAQGALGAAIAGAHGRSQPLPARDMSNAPDVHATMAQTPENKATGAATENHVTNMHADETPSTDQWEGEGGNTGRLPPPPAGPAQHELDFPVHPDLQAAVNAHFDETNLGYRGQPPVTENATPMTGADPFAREALQEQLPLRGGMNPSERPGPTPPVPATAQLNLPLERQARGGPEQSPVVSPSAERAPVTRADQLRERAAGNQDWNQPDMLRQNQAVGPSPSGRGELQLPHNRPVPEGSPDHPSAEPFSDIQAQLNDLKDPQHPRTGVYLSADNMATLRRSGLLERVRDESGPEAVPLPNFDGKGGALIAKNQAAAETLTHYRDQKVGSMQEIIGEATGAGNGKRGNGELTVQQKDARGNVTRETVAESPEHAAQLQREYATNGRTAETVSTPGALLRRSRLTGLENEVQTRARGEQETGNAVRRAAERIPDETVSQRVRAAAARDLGTREASPAINPEEAARRMTAEAQQIHNETGRRAWSGLGAPHPGDVDFHSEHLQEQYRGLDHELAGMRVMLNTADGPEARAHAQAGLDMAERRITEFLNNHDHELRAKQAARAAHEVSPTGVREFVEAKQQAGRRHTKPLERIDTKALEPLPRATRGELHAMHPDELKPLYEEAVEKTATPKLTPEEEAERNAAAEQGGRPRQTMTREEMEAQDQGLRSLQEKRINRFYRTEAEHKAIGPVKSDKMAVSPRRALTERQIQENASKKGGAKHVGFKTFDPRNLLADVQSQKEMEANTVGRAEFRQMRTDMKKGLRDSVRLGEKSIKELNKVQADDVERGTPSMARQYLRQILQYGRALRDGTLGSSHALSAARQFSAHVEALSKMPPAKRAQFMIDTYQTELKRQMARGAGANPERVGRIETAGDEIVPQEATGEGGNQLRLGTGEKYSGNRTSGNQLHLPFNERLQPKFGYEGARRPALTGDELEELRGLSQRAAKGPLTDAQKKLALRGGQAEPQGTTLEGNLTQYREGKVSTEDHSVHVAADALGKMFEENDVLRGPNIVRSLMNNLESGTAAHDLASQLRPVIGHDTVVGWGKRSDFPADSESYFGKVTWEDQGPVVKLNRDHFDYIRAQGVDPRGELVTTLLHEFSHIATMKKLMSDDRLHTSIEALRMEALQHTGKDVWNGLTSPREFVADGYSDPKFREFLRGIESTGGKNLWERFKDLARHAIAYLRGTDFQPKTTNLLDRLMEHHNEMWTGEKYATAGHDAASALRTDMDGKHLGNMLDRTMKSMALDRDTRSELAGAASRTLHGEGQFGLSAMTPRQMTGQFSKYFQRADGSNPYKGYWDTYFKRAADNAISMEKVGKISNIWSKLEDAHGPDQAASLSRIMHDASTYGFHPDLAADAPGNSHVIGANIARAAETRTAFQALHQDVQAQYQRMKEYYKTEQQSSVDQVVLNGLHAMLTKGDEAVMTPKEFDSKYDAAAVRRLELGTADGLKKEFGDKLDESSQRLLAQMGKLSESKGPYFPLMRNGDFVVTSRREIANKAFTTSEEAQAYAREQRGNDPTLAVKVNKGEDGYSVSVTERDIRMAESRSEAARNQAEMSARYGSEETSPVQLKADLYQGQSSITTGSALDRLIQKLEGNPAAQSAIKDFYLRTLGEQSFRKRELARENWRGVDPENQHRSFANYGRSQSYWLSQLKHGRYLANAQAEVHKTVRAHRDESEVSAVRMGEFAKELALRDEISRSPYEVSKLVQRGSAITQVMMLTSPSHWLVRGIQPLTLTAPWLAARHGFTDSLGALGRAANMIKSPIAREAVTSGLGLKALWSRVAAENTYSVLDSVMSHITQTAGADAKPINEMLQGLRNNNLIDISMATELSDIAQGESGAYNLATGVKNASRAMLHLLEVNNRAMTAIASRELGLKQGMTEAQAREHAAQAIIVTHNDYSYGNTPRLFMQQAKGVTGSLRPLMFQFMKYPQQVYGMMLSSGLAALKGKTPLEQKQGLHTLVGVFATHMLAAGAIGASIQPMKWAVGAALAGASALGMTDKDYTLPNALSGDTYDHILREVTTDLFGTDLGEILAKGLPAALGVDLSQRMALGSTYQFHLKTDSDTSLIGSLAQTFGGPWLNVASNFYDGGRSILNGDVVKGIQQFSPHILRDLIKAGMLGQNGLMNNAGTTLIPADKISGPELFAQSMGLRPERIAEIQDRNNAERTAMANIQGDRKALIQKYVAGKEPSERQEVWTKVQEFNQLHPGFKLDYSELRQAQVKQKDSERQMQRYGARIKAKQLPEITREGAPYNVQ
jgi:hypothetical protein